MAGAIPRRAAIYEDEWWQKGIPLQIRKECQSRKEEDATSSNDPYQFTNLIDLKTIIDKEWPEFSVVLPKPLKVNKQETLRNLQRINDIRKRVMHPVKAMRDGQDDLKWMCSSEKQLGISRLNKITKVLSGAETGFQHSHDIAVALAVKRTLRSEDLDAEAKLTDFRKWPRTIAT